MKPRPITVTALLAFVLAASLAFASVGLASRHAVRCVIRNGTSCPGAVLNNRNLHGAHLKGAHLQRAHLVHANLRGADLRGANLTRADLRRANLSGANLAGANLAGANLAGANLAGARLQGARLAGAILTGVSGKIIGRPASLPAGWVLKGGYLVRPAVVRRPPTPLGVPSLSLTPGTGSLAINPFPAVPNASSYAAQQCDAAGNNCQTAVAVTTLGRTFTGLTNGITYTIKLTAIGNGTTYSNSVAAARTGVPGAVPLIVDTEIYDSVDGVGALSTAFALQNKGEANVVAMLVDTRTTRTVAPNSWQCAAAIAQFYGHPGTLLGSDGPSTGADPTTHDFLAPCASKGTAVATPPSAVSVYRQALASQPDHSVVIASTGYLENLQALLQSPKGGFSSLTGHQLVAQKVRMLVAEGGGYPSMGPRNNFSGNAIAAEYVAANWPTKIVWSGYEIGIQVQTGGLLSKSQPITSPVRAAYEAFLGGPNRSYASWDLATVYHAIVPSDPSQTEVGPGTNVVNTTPGPTTYGANTFTLGAGNQYYLQLNNLTGLESSLNGLLDAPA